MRLSRADIGALAWLGTAACLLFAFFGFATTAPWTFHVMSASEAVLRCPGAIDASWPACSAIMAARQVGAWSDPLHPLRYSVSLLQMIIGLSAFFFGASRMKRFR